MQVHVDSCAPLEACGLLAGHGNFVEQAIRIGNMAQSPTAFRMDPKEQIRAFEDMEAAGLELVGIYHSHPQVPEAMPPVREEPSPTDVAEAAYPVVQIIWSRPTGKWQARGFWIESGRLSEVELHLADGQ